jgi:hypothetical protein
MVGFVVTPDTESSAIFAARFPLVILPLDKSSSQIETPAAANAFRRSFIVDPLLVCGCRAIFGHPTHSRGSVCGAAGSG